MVSVRVRGARAVPGNRTRISEPDSPAQLGGGRPLWPSLAVVTQPGTVGSGIELATVLRFVDIAVDALAGAREEIDALNVYPVPDGDTGTNMYLTMAAARDAVRESGAVERAAVFEAFTRGALLGAINVSGLSQRLDEAARRRAVEHLREVAGGIEAATRGM